jgi:predicted acetyltransferase
MLTLSFRLGHPQDESVLGNLLELYQHDMSDFVPEDVNADGRFALVDAQRYLEDSRCAAHFFLSDGAYAGFGLVDQDVLLPESQYRMAEFFVLRKYRRAGIGARAARHIFDQKRGKWEVAELVQNARARDFWRETLSSYASDTLVEQKLERERWSAYIHCFDNSLAA